MKLGPVSKREKKSNTMSKDVGDDVISKNYDVTVIFLLHGQSGAIQKPDSERIVYKTYVSINNNLLSYKR